MFRDMYGWGVAQSRGMCLVSTSLPMISTSGLFSDRKFTNEALVELERFYAQKVSDFHSILINFVQLQMHINKKVITAQII